VLPLEILDKYDALLLPGVSITLSDFGDQFVMEYDLLVDVTVVNPALGGSLDAVIEY
jgi:hypothetical protein